MQYEYLIHTTGYDPIPEEGIEKRDREGLDGRVWGHWYVRGGAFCISLPSGTGREDSMVTNGDRKTNNFGCENDVSTTLCLTD